MYPTRTVSRTLLSLWTAVLVCGASPAFAAPGDPDPTLDGDGVLETDLGSKAEAYGVAVQPDGKIIAVGWRETAPTFIVARFELDGSPDLSFGSGGVASADFGVGGEAASAIVLAPDGKIVVAGTVAGPGAGSQIAIARFDDTGALDSSFGGDGMTTTDVAAGTDDTASTLVRLASGRLVVGGSTKIAGSPHGVLVGYGDGGELDLDFGDGGVVVMADPERINGLTASSSAILAAGASGFFDLVFARFLLDGSPVGVTHIASAVGNAIALDPNGRVLVGGWTFEANRPVTLVARFGKSGRLDSHFGSAGIATIDVPAGDLFDGGDQARALAVQPDGQIIVAAVDDSLSPPPFSQAQPIAWLVRFEDNGELDSAFGDGGLERTAGGTLASLAVQSDGKVVTGGRRSFQQTPTSGLSFMVIARNEAFVLACAATPQAGCAAPATTAASSIAVTEISGKAPKLLWKWGKGTATVGDFGDPTVPGAYAICAYDASPALVFGAQVEGGSTCGSKPCWKATGSSGFLFKDGGGVQWGIDKIKLKAGAGTAQLSVQGKHAALPHVPLPSSLPLPLRLQLQTPNGTCFEAVFSTASTNDAIKLKAKSD
jgi:uncharacterized delta-60 repeat protein